MSAKSAKPLQAFHPAQQDIVPFLLLLEHIYKNLVMNYLNKEECLHDEVGTGLIMKHYDVVTEVLCMLKRF